MNLNFELDQAGIDNLEAVTFTSVATAGNSLVAVPDAAFYRLGAGISEAAPSAGVYERSDAIFAIRTSLLAGVGGAKPADVITRADGSVWTVLSAKPPVISGVWQLTCRDLILANGLRDVGTLTRPTATQDATGRPALTSYTTVAAGIPCRVQPIGGRAGDTFQRRTLPQRFTAYLGVQVVAQAKDAFTVGSVTYGVIEFKLPARIDSLMELTLEAIG